MSGPGQVTPLFSSFDGGAIRLENFDIEKHALKQEHKDGLKQWVLPFLRQGGSARVVGLTSTTGSPEYNQALSRRRAGEVVRALRDLLGEMPRVITTTWMGEQVAAAQGPDQTEDSTWRAVTVFYHKQPDPPVEPVPQKVVKRFEIKKVKRPTAGFLGSGDGDHKGAAGTIGTQVLWTNSITTERPVLVPDTFVVTRIEVTKGVSQGQYSSFEAQDDTYRFWWGPAKGVVEVWRGAAKKGLPIAKEWSDPKVIDRVTPTRAMRIYEHPEDYDKN